MENISKITENLMKIAEYETLIAALKKENDDIYYSLSRQYDKVPIEKLELSKKTYKMLKDHSRRGQGYQLRTVADVITGIMADIDHISNVRVHTKGYLRGYGLGCWTELCEKLEEFGYSDDNTKTILKEHDVYHMGLPSRLVTMLVDNKIYSKEQLKHAYESGELMQIKYICMFEQEIKEVIF